jgi:hypothetical protein
MAPILMYERARCDYLAADPPDRAKEQAAEGVTFLTPIGKPRQIPHDDVVRDLYREHFLREVVVEGALGR